MSLKQKTVNGLTWSFLDNFAYQGITFLVGIVIARLVAPEEFGVIGMITLFIAISSTFVNSGFSSALIRKQNATEIDYNTVFYFNLAVSFFFYFILFLASPYIADFFEEPRLILILRVLSLNLILSAFSIVQSVILSKKIDFKKQAKISVCSSILSGAVGIVCAYQGMGVWALVWRMVAGAFFSSFFLWVWGRWKPQLLFSWLSFKELFSFGSKLLLSSLLDTTFKNIYYPIIGKCFSPSSLGFYTRAESYCALFSSTLTGNIQRVTYPVLSSVQDNSELLKSTYKRLIKSTMLIAFTMMLALAATAKPLILILIGDVWLPTVPFLQLMCFSAMFYPLHALNLNAINVKGRSDLFLKLEIIKKILTVPIIFIGIYWGIEALLIGRIITSIVAYFLNSYYSADLINYSTKEQLKDILPSLGVALVAAFSAWSITFLDLNIWLTLGVQLLLGLGMVIGLCRLLKLAEYVELKTILIENVNKLKNGIRK